MTNTHYLTVEQIAKLVAGFDLFELIDFFEAMPYDIMLQIYSTLHERIETGEWPS